MLGPNGASKSTTIKILIGYLHPDSGSVTINGLDLLTHTQEVQAQIGYLPETTPLYGDLSVQSYLKLMADMRGIPAADQPPLISEAIVVTSLQNFRARPISQLSKGLRQRDLRAAGRRGSGLPGKRFVIQQRAVGCGPLGEHTLLQRHVRSGDVNQAHQHKRHVRLHQSGGGLNDGRACGR